MRRKLFYGCVRGLAGLVETAPRGAAVTAMRGLADLAWRTRPADRARALRQLAVAFPESSPEHRHHLARASLRALADNLVSAVRADEPVGIEPDDEARLAEALAGSRPALFLTAHLGCWEVLGRFLARRAGRLGVVTANPHNPAVYEWLKRRREEAGLVVFDRDRPLGAARWLGRGRPLAILADLRGRGASIRAPWFGVDAPTVLTPARWAQRFGARMIPVGIRRHGPGHRVWLGPDVDLQGVDGRTAAARCNRALTDMITQVPEEWVWVHDRYGESEGASR